MARKILLADDSVTAQNMGRKILADAGYEVIAVNNGSAALKKIAELKPDLVVLDVYMPGYSGLEVCQRLKESPETARIPVLLSVGKLEPFKPEEAQRVRADGFIVKPFEASELLSALAKLEDKVVPRAEPSKPGRFARAIAAAEESSRGSRKEPSAEDNGWKTRIGFPHQKTEAEEKAADESPIYNQMNRDLRTVVDKSTEESAPQAEKSGEASVDAPPPVPPNILNDVTPEEVAAIAAAVAQMQMAAAADDLTLPPPVQAVTEAGAEASAKTAALPESKGDSVHETAVAASDSDVPVTMAAGADSEVSADAGSSRWTAVSVALDSDEAALSLENEMRQAYSAFVANEPDHALAVAPAAAEPAPGATERLSSGADSAQYHSSSPEQAVAESPVAVLSIPESEPVATAASPEATAASVAQSVVEETLTSSTAAAVSERLPEPTGVLNEAVAEAVPAPPSADALPQSESAATSAPVEANQEPALVDTSAAAVAAEAEAVSAPGAHELQAAPEAVPEIAQAVAASFGGYAPTSYAQVLHKAEHEIDPKPESEVVKSTAAAWASWRQVRDTGDSRADAAAEATLPKSNVPESAAMAVAAGAEHPAPEISAEQPTENSADLASIVDSVLADLRPRLMAEISRKMSEKK